jgi:hypothetical protein
MTTMFEIINIITERFIPNTTLYVPFITPVGVVFPGTSDMKPSRSKQQNVDSLIFYSGSISFDSQQKYW